MTIVEEWWSFAQKVGQCVGNTYFQHRSIHTYTRVARGRDGVDTEHDRSSAGEEGYAAICAECEDGDRDGTRLPRPPYILCKVTLVGPWIKRREVVVRAWSIRSEKLREHQYSEGYTRYLEGKGVEWNGDDNVEHMWE